MDQEKIERINALAKKSREAGLTDTEKSEQKKLREEYIAAFRESMTGVLSNMYIQTPDGKRKKVEKKK